MFECFLTSGFQDIDLLKTLSQEGNVNAYDRGNYNSSLHLVQSS